MMPKQRKPLQQVNFKGHISAMTEYRRHRIPGGTYFFTVNLYDRRTALLTAKIEILGAAIRKVRATKPFQINAFVVLPDHLHAVWTLPESDLDYSGRWRAIKTEFSKQIPPNEWRSASRAAKGERGLWQRRFWEHTIRDDKDFATHIDYIHWNPVKHGLATSAADWPHSSFHKAVENGLYPADWAGTGIDLYDAGEVDPGGMRSGSDG
jgi:putative transposase